MNEEALHDIMNYDDDIDITAIYADTSGQKDREAELSAYLALIYIQNCVYTLRA